MRRAAGRSHRQPAIDREHSAGDVRALLAATYPTAVAISAGSANRPIGTDAVISASRAGPTSSTIAVAALGEIALTVVPNRAVSFATVLVNAMIPPFAAA